MKKINKILIGIQVAVLMTAVALPVQAALLIGGPLRPLSGSVVSLKSNVITSIPAPTPVQTQVTPNPFPVQNTTTVQASIPTKSQPIIIGQPKPSGNVISLKNISNQPQSVPVTPTSTTPVVTTPPNTTTAPSTTPSLPLIPILTEITAEEQSMIDLINQERIAAGVNPVKLDLRLASVGRAKANDLKTNNYFDHTSPIYGSPWAMMQQVGLKVVWAGENISGNKSVVGSMASLMLSPGHRANILDPRFTHVGIGIAYGSAYGNLYVQEFLQQ